ncbi:hypothetical protein [Parageobacillus thermoglucosidasius]|jgi:hypothetical protein|uniref:hypothetical protein n=1 Tax=Parageobacillus thermoglucosidasius TaxID=1426 RepID=UPI000B00D34B|nr:hypothetical protein [Parageobacillus thermoglucosidasius]
MKVKALMDCKGVGYDLKKGDVADLPKGLATLLIRFGYVEEVKKSKETKVEE